MRKHAILIVWILGILFPMGWFARLWPQSGQLFEELFHLLWTHVVMHAVLFAVLAYLLTYQLARRKRTRPRWRVIGGALVVVLMVAITQEGIQLLYQARPPGGDEVFDAGG